MYPSPCGQAIRSSQLFVMINDSGMNILLGKTSSPFVPHQFLSSRIIGSRDKNIVKSFVTHCKLSLQKRWASASMPAKHENPYFIST